MIYYHIHFYKEPWHISYLIVVRHKYAIEETQDLVGGMTTIRRVKLWWVEWQHLNDLRSHCCGNLTNSKYLKWFWCLSPNYKVAVRSKIYEKIGIWYLFVSHKVCKRLKKTLMLCSTFLTSNLFIIAIN